MGSSEKNSDIGPPDLIVRDESNTVVSHEALSERILNVLTTSDEGILPSDLVTVVTEVSSEFIEHPDIALTPEDVRDGVKEIRAMGVDVYTDEGSGALHIFDEEL